VKYLIFVLLFVLAVIIAFLYLSEDSSDQESLNTVILRKSFNFERIFTDSIANNSLNKLKNLHDAATKEYLENREDVDFMTNHIVYWMSVRLAVILWENKYYDLSLENLGLAYVLGRKIYPSLIESKRPVYWILRHMDDNIIDGNIVKPVWFEYNEYQSLTELYYKILEYDEFYEENLVNYPFDKEGTQNDVRHPK